MIRRTALLSTLTLSLLLSACGKNKDGADAGADAQTQAQAQDAEQGAAAAPEQEAPPPQLAYWPVVGPFLAGSYGGECLRMPDARKMDGAIDVGADGKVSAGGLDLDFRAAHKLVLGRMRDAEGHFSTMAILAMEDDKAGLLSLNSGAPLKESTASLAHKDIALMCSKVKADKLNAQPLHVALSKLLNGKKQTLSCLDTKNLMLRRDVDVELAGGVIRIGDASFDLKAADAETITIDDAGRSMALGVVMPDKRMINLFYDGAGKLTGAMGMNEQESTHSCEEKKA